MLEVLLTASFAFAAPQAPTAIASAAVAVRGDTELTPAEAFASARRRAEEHLREQWHQRAEVELAARRPFWLPEALAERELQRWLGDLPVADALRLVDREDRQRTHEFGNSYQTTLWVAEEPGSVQRGERQLRQQLRQLERVTAAKFGGVVGSWLLVLVVVAWFDRLTRGYMTGTLRLLGLLTGAAVPAFLFLV
ncbi:MAG: hypothetical protein JNL08_03145 [Planctomycetes bacterium]|nr:hypothetical protein [Planctomycetota bacterium]